MQHDLPLLVFATACGLGRASENQIASSFRPYGTIRMDRVGYPFW